MQEMSIPYRKLMRAGSIVSLFFLCIGLIVHAFASGDPAGMWSWRTGYPYLMIGIFTLLLTPIAGLGAFFIYNLKIKDYLMSLFIASILALLIGGTWFIHPGN